MEFYAISKKELEELGIVPSQKQKLLQYETLGAVLEYLEDESNWFGNQFPFEKVEELENALIDNELYTGEDFAYWVEQSLNDINFTY